MALHACAHVRVLTEPLLREALEQEDVHAVFSWLRGLSFIEQGPFGLFPHDLAREVLDSDLRWRDPDGYVALHRRVRGYIVQHLTETQGLEQMRHMFDLVYLHRSNPILQPYVHWKELGTIYAEPARPADHRAILLFVAQHAGEESADLAEYWLARQPEAWNVMRDARGEVAGIFVYLSLHATTPEDREQDPAVKAAWEHAQRHTPLRPGDAMTLGRIYVNREDYLRPSPVVNTAEMAMNVRWMTNPRLAWSFILVAYPEYWHALMSYLNFQRAAEADFEMDGVHYGIYAHDWRAMPMSAWLDLMGGRELATDLRVEDLAAAPPQVVVLSQPEFEDAVKNALRDFHSPSTLASNPLLRSRLVADKSGEAPAPAALQALLREAAERLKAKPKDEKFYRALEATYFTPAATQEMAAGRLGLPFNTYRYQLGKGLQRVTEWLWQRELYGPEG